MDSGAGAWKVPTLRTRFIARLAIDFEHEH